MQHYREALNNARKNPKDTWNLLKQPIPGKLKQNTALSPPEVQAH